MCLCVHCETVATNGSKNRGGECKARVLQDQADCCTSVVYLSRSTQLAGWNDKTWRGGKVRPPHRRTSDLALNIWPSFFVLFINILINCLMLGISHFLNVTQEFVYSKKKHVCNTVNTNNCFLIPVKMMNKAKMQNNYFLRSQSQHLWNKEINLVSSIHILA